MDTITHIVLGASIGEAIAGKKMGKRAMLWGAIANNVPDIDVFYSSFQKIPDSLLSHRGFTHSILFAIIASPLLAMHFNRVYYRKNYGWKTWLLIFSTGLFAHIFIDAFTNYGTGWFEPFSHYRVSFNTIFVLDPFYTIWLLISFIALLILKASSRLRKYFLTGGLTLSTIYFLFTIINKITINHTFEKSLHAKNIDYTSCTTNPVPLSNFLWYGMAKTDNGYYAGYRSIFDRNELMDLYSVACDDSLLTSYEKSPEIQKLIRFSRGYYCATKSDTSGLEFYVMGFGQAGGWDDPNAPFVFSLHIQEYQNNRINIAQNHFRSITADDFRSLIKRIKGK